ncbi:hypothetical protein [Streptomyces sp. NBC_01422]|uniref:hypothetical protein n=1 Tax=Streptomyces sp. NBC_01422 TaxID=2903859 RepID=UPI002E2B5F04|nr:hypothetical protein [Streptomyces sp. NBC_01422]
MDLTTLKALKPAAFERAADGYRATGDMAATAKDHVDNVVAAGLRKSLNGLALDAAAEELSRLSANFHYTQIECGLISTALNGFAHDMEAARNKLLSALDDATALKVTVNSDGSVAYPEAQPKSGAGPPLRGGTVGGVTDPTAQAVGRQSALLDPNPHHGEALAVADRIAAALKEAAQADAKWAPRIRALRADDDLAVSSQDLKDAQSDMRGVLDAGKEYLDSIGGPPKDATPQQNAEWWKGLTPEEREAYLSARPELIGGLDGLPAEARDEANRIVLAEKKAEYGIRLDAHPEPPADEWTWINAGGTRVPGPHRRMDGLGQEVRRRVPAPQRLARRHGGDRDPLRGHREGRAARGVSPRLQPGGERPGDHRQRQPGHGTAPGRVRAGYDVESGRSRG